MDKTPPRLVSAFLEVPHDGTYQMIRIYVKSEDGLDLTSQSIIDAVSDALIDMDGFSYDEGGPDDLPDSWNA